MNDELEMSVLGKSKDFIAAIRKITKNLSEGSWSPGRVSKAGTPELEAGVVITL